MKYTVGQLVKRAKNLADISNTDFLSYTELTQYVNDAWTTLYQWLINNGDKQFVTEVRLQGTGVGNYVEYAIPHDLYQIISIKSKWGGLLTRHSDSQGRNHNGTYEVINNKIRIYSGLDDLILTYYRIPLFLTFPDKQLKVDLGNKQIISSAGNAVLFSDGEIKNLLSGETLGQIEIKDGRSYKLGNGHVVETYITDAVLTDTWAFNNTTFYDAECNEIERPDGEVVEESSFPSSLRISLASDGKFYTKEVVQDYAYNLYEDSIIMIDNTPTASDFVSPIDPFYTDWTAVKDSSLGSYYSYADKWYKKVETEYFELLSRSAIAETLDNVAVSDQIVIDNLDASNPVEFYQMHFRYSAVALYDVDGFTTTGISRGPLVLPDSGSYTNPSTEFKAQLAKHLEIEATSLVQMHYRKFRKAAGAYITYLDYSGNSIYTTMSEDSSFSLSFDEDFNIYYQIMRLGGYGDIYLMDSLSFTVDEPRRAIQVLDDDYWFVDNEGNLNSANYGLIYEFSYIPEEIIRTDDWELNKCFIIKDSNNKFHLLIIHDMPNAIEEIDLDIKSFKTLALLKYGPLITNGTSASIHSHIPDTALNFPNELYFSLIAADLGLRFACKMNANTDGLNSIYTNMKNQYLNSLGQDGDYLRIKNVYGAR